MTRTTIQRLLIIASVVLIAGSVGLAIRRADRLLRMELLQQARVVAVTLNPQRVAALTGTEADIASPDYQRLKEQLATIRQGIPKYHFLYLMGRRNNGPVFFLVDSEPADSKDGSPPGQIFEEASSNVLSLVAEGQTGVLGPKSDRWGTWVTAFIPLPVSAAGATQTVLGIDIDAHDWKMGIARHAALPAGLTALAVLLTLVATGLYRSRRRIRAQQEQLLQSDAQKHAILNGITTNVALVDSHLNILWANKAAADSVHKRAEDMVGHPCFYFWGDSIRPCSNCPTLVALQTGKSAHKIVQTPDGRVWDESGEPIFDSAGHVVAVVEIAQDISMHKQAEQRIQTLLEESNQARRALLGILEDQQRAQEEKSKLEANLVQSQKMESVGRLAGGVAHDFNNILTVILGHSELALARVHSGEPIHEDLMEIRNAAERSADLTRQLLAFARKQTVAPKVLDLNKTIESLLKMLQRLIGENIELVWQPQPGVWPIRIDPSQIDQILANLCVNARDAISGIGKITISTESATFNEAYCSRHPGFFQGQFVLLSVRDTGCGMSKETLDHIFEPFFTTKEVGKGTGLGLATVYGTVQQNNGFLHVASEPGQGTTFQIFLPRHVGKSEPGLTENAAPPVMERGHETILLVEDEPAILKMTSAFLHHQGYTVLAASTPGEALRIARTHTGQIHLLLTDVVMPEMNGRDLARDLKRQHPQIQILFMSGYTADVIAQNGMLDEGVHFIQKPFSQRDLAAMIRNALDSATP